MHAELPDILAMSSDALWPRMMRVIEGLAEVAVPRELFGEILRLIAMLWGPSAPV